jgi:hypothetical protein
MKKGSKAQGLNDATEKKRWGERVRKRKGDDNILRPSGP